MGTYIIAEAGVNHNGSLKTAKELVDAAKEAGADCVKFQTFKSELLVTGYADKADYQNQNTGTEESQYDMLKKLELSYSDFRELYDYCNRVGIEFLSTAFDMESAVFLSELGMKAWKIPSGEITNRPLLEYIGSLNTRIIMSTGMSNIEEIREALEVLNASEKNEIILLHCTTDYPAPYASVNLKAMVTLAEEFGCKVGYSDHTLGYEVAAAAVALGAVVVEKHFTLDKNMEGPDHKASLEPQELTDFVKAIRHIDEALGDGIKDIQKVEYNARSVARKSIVAARPIKKGEQITEDSVTVKRPGTGISPMRINEVVGSYATRDFDIDEMIEI